MKKEYLTLSDAQKEGRLDDFARQEEARGIGRTDRDRFDKTLSVLIKSPPAEGQTSRSASRGGSNGK